MGIHVSGKTESVPCVVEILLFVADDLVLPPIVLTDLLFFLTVNLVNDEYLVKKLWWIVELMERSYAPYIVLRLDFQQSIRLDYGTVAVQ